MAILKSNLINGEKPQFGNTEHIAFVREQERLQIIRDEGGSIPVNVDTEEYTTYEVSFGFKCISCGNGISISKTFEDEDPDDFGFSCYKCRQRYELEYDNEVVVFEKS